ncbi:MAG TPA: hypothetical protein VML75_09910 [Kofleriaceae bacterium]|nr:hypothetical protein [Kofleriaceae bacterium]
MADLQEHRYRFRTIAELARHPIESQKAEFLVERDRRRLRVNENAGAADIGGHLLRQREHGTKQQRADALVLRALVGGSPSQAQDGNRVTRTLLALWAPHGLRRDLRGRNRRESGDEAGWVNGDVRGADVIPELVLPCVAKEEAIEIYIAAVKPAAIVIGLEPTNLERSRVEDHRSWLAVHGLARHQIA